MGGVEFENPALAEIAFDGRELDKVAYFGGEYRIGKFNIAEIRTFKKSATVAGDQAPQPGNVAAAQGNGLYDLGLKSPVIVQAPPLLYGFDQQVSRIAG